MKPGQKRSILGQAGKNAAVKAPSAPVVRDRAREKRKIAACVFLIICAGLLAYGNSLKGGFIWDDSNLITDRLAVADLSGLARFFAQDIGHGGPTVYRFFRPLQMLSYVLDYRLWRLDPFGYHLSNLFWQLLAALSCFWFVFQVSRSLPVALLTSFFFAVHPVHTEAVAYVSGRTDPLALTFIFLTLIFALRQDRRVAPGVYLSMLLSYSCALLSREQALVAPFLLWAYQVSFRVRIRPRIYAGLGILALAYVLVRLFVLRELIGPPANPTTLIQRGPGVFVALARYLTLLVWPFDLHMEYGIILFPFRYPLVWAGMAALAALVAVSLTARRPIVRFSVWWFLISWLPVSNLYPLNAYMAEHWLYMPSVGFFLLLGEGLVLLARKGKSARAVSCAIGSLLISFWITLTVRQNLLWADPVAFHERLAQFAPSSARVFNNLGNYYQQQGRLPEAIEAYRKAIALRPDQADAYVNLGAAYQAIGKTGEAIGMYQEALALAPGHANAHLNLSIAYCRKGRYDEAIVHYDLARKAGIVKDDLGRILEPHRKN